MLRTISWFGICGAWRFSAVEGMRSADCILNPSSALALLLQSRDFPL